MGRLASAGRGRRGGESIPALRAAYLRLAAATAALAVAVALAVYPLERAGKLAPLVYGLAGAALLTLLVPLLWRGRGAWLPVLLLAGEYVAVEATGRAPAISIAAYAAGLIALCELLFWLAELPRSARVDRAVVAVRLLSLVLVVAAGAMLALVTLLASSVQIGSALLAALLGALAAVSLLAIPWLLLRS